MNQCSSAAAPAPKEDLEDLPEQFALLVKDAEFFIACLNDFSEFREIDCRIDTIQSILFDINLKSTHYNACSHMYASRLLTTDAILNTNEQNQKLLTTIWSVVLASLTENCKVVAVTAEKKVATVDNVRKLVAAWV